MRDAVKLDLRVTAITTGRPDSLTCLAEALDGVPVSNAEQALLEWPVEFELSTVRNIAERVDS